MTQGPLPYLEFCGVEIANAGRTYDYLYAGLGNTGTGNWTLTANTLCSVLYRLNGGDCTGPDVFISPSADPAPWYDSAEQGSDTFLGLVLLDLNGYDSTIARSVANRPGPFGGGVFAQQTRTPREWTFRGALVSSDDAGAEYGLRWITSVLQTSACDTCGSCNLAVRLVCPPADCSDDTLGEWISYEVALVGGPHEVQKWAPKPSGMDTDVLAGCRNIVFVEWTMVAANPFLYKQAVVCLDETLTNDTPCVDIEYYLFGDSAIDAVCCDVVPPRIGVLGTIYTLYSEAGIDGTLLLEIYTECPSTSGDEAWKTIALSSVPAGGTVVVDSSKRTLTLTTEETSGEPVTVDAWNLLVLTDGEVLEWLDIRDCDNAYCVCFRIGSDCTQGTISVTIETQHREG